MKALVDLLELRTPLVDAVAAVRELPWDSEVELIVLTRQHVSNMLRQYLTGCLTEPEVELWANVVEGREDIGFAAESADLLSAFIFEAANPLITEPMSPARAEHWLIRLR